MNLPPIEVPVPILLFLSAHACVAFLVGIVNVSKALPEWTRPRDRKAARRQWFSANGRRRWLVLHVLRLWYTAGLLLSGFYAFLAARDLLT